MTIIPPPLQEKKEYPVSAQQFEMRQPPSEHGDVTDQFYYDFCNLLAIKLQKSKLPFMDQPALCTRIALGVTNYLQDIVADGGVWRAFSNLHHQWYGKWLPFYPVSDDYIEHELNPEDVRWLVWYILTMSCESLRQLNPMSPEVKRIADLAYGMLDIVYDDAPVSEVWRDFHHLDRKDEEDREAIMELSHWLFMYCYLISPAYALTMTEILSDPNIKQDDITAIQARIEESMTQEPTGPLALFLGEWLDIILTDGTKTVSDTFGGHHPAAPDKSALDNLHPLYVKFTAATDGKEIAYFSDYEQLNRFFIDALGWGANEEHLSHLKEFKNFVLLVNPAKGMLLAKGVAQNIADPDNPLYDPNLASRESVWMLMVRGYSPCDLTLYCCKRGWLKDAKFPASALTSATATHDPHALVADNYDFITRCYLQKYYRD